jgi:transcriptional regulator of acetoin/glycerol metabolism
MIDADRESLEDGGERFSMARPEILNSWRRSQSCGVSPDGVPMVEGEVSLETRIARVAIPVLSEMADILRGGRTSLLLSAADGTMLWRWSDDSTLTALLDRRSAVVGTRWNEDIIGTNGLGTALETMRPILIQGDEHYCEGLHGFTCAGAPIRHPITGRVSGVLSVTTLVEHTSPLMAPTLLKLAREIEEQLYAGSSLRERELLYHFLAEQRRGTKAIVAINEDVVIANKAGAHLSFDHRELWDRYEAGDLSDDPGAMRLRAIEHAGAVVGLVIVADDPADPEPEPARRAVPAVTSPGPARTPLWSELPELLRAVTRGCDRILVTGETGVGKRTLLRETFASAEQPMIELDCVASEELGNQQWLAEARSTLEDDGAGFVVLSHLETLTPSLCRALSRMLDQLERHNEALALAATWTPTDASPEPALRDLIDRFTAEPFEVPPLRKRPDDVLPRLTDQGLGAPVLSRKAAARARLHPWPGNHRQLDEFRRWLRRQNRAVVDLADLPPNWAHDAASIRLTPIQTAEADAIAKALRANGGNKVAAAAELGISRSSLYRKMQAYRLR